MVQSSGLTHTPFTLTLILTVLTSSLLTSILSLQPYLPIKPIPHLWPYLQLSRILTFQFAYISSSELLFGVVLLYQFRVLERLWGSRKYGSFVIVVLTVLGVVIPSVGVVVKILTFGLWGYIPPGVTGLVWALLAVWRSEVPGLWGVKVITGLSGSSRTTGTHGGDESAATGSQTRSGGSEDLNEEPGFVFSDKFSTYLLAVQLSLSQFPYQLLPALLGWVVGVAWREEMLPTGMVRWRIPGWIVGEDATAKRSRGQYEGLRRRLEEEGGSTRDGMREVSDGVVSGQPQEERRGFGRTVLGYFTGS